MKRTIAIVLTIALLACLLPTIAMAAGCNHENAYEIPAWGVWRCDCGLWADEDPRPVVHVHTMSPSCRATAQMWGMAICADCGEWYSVR